MSDLVPAKASSSSPAPASRPAAALPTEKRGSVRQLARNLRLGRVGLVPADRCDAWVPEGNYRRAGQCEKRHGLRAIGRVTLCAHHRTQLEIRGRVELSDGGMAIERGAR